MKRILMSMVMIGVVAASAVSATKAYFSDTETGKNNTFTAGTLDLKVNGGDSNVSYTFNNMEPIHSQPNLTFRLKNAGSIDGFLDIQNVTILSKENTCIDPEEGDTTCGTGDDEGELDKVVNLRLMLDNNCNGWYEASDQILYDGVAEGVAGQYDISKNLAPNAETCANVLVNWPSTANDNKTQSDDMTLDMTFELGQEASL